MLATCGGAIIAMLLLFPGTAFAHNEYVSSSPSDGDSFTVVPEFWEITFAKEVPLSSATAEVIAADGVRTQLTDPRHGATTNIVLYSLPPDLVGTVSARWKLVSDDGHVVQGRVSFTVAGATVTSLSEIPTDSATDATTPAVVAPEDSAGSFTSPAPDIVRWGVRTMGFSAVILLGGLLFVDKLLAGGTLVSASGILFSRISAAVLFTAPFLQNLFLVGDLRSSGAISALPHFFSSFDMTAGAMFIMLSLIGAVIAVLFFIYPDSTQLPSTARLLHALGAMYLIALAFVGHSRTMAWPLLGIPADIIHTAAAALWLGGLVVIVFILAPILPMAQLISVLRNFGTFAQKAVIALVVTGIIQTLRLHGNIVSLFTENHGRILIVKILVVAAMLKIADINRRRMMRNLTPDAEITQRRITLLTRASTTEIATGGIVIAITAMLVNASL